MEQDLCPVENLLNDAVILTARGIYRLSFPAPGIVHLEPVTIDPTSGSISAVEGSPKVFTRLETLEEEGYSLLRNTPLFTITPN